MNTTETPAKPQAPAHMARLSLTDAEYYYRQGRVTMADLTQYLRAWNAGPHFTRAVWKDNGIRQFDPESAGDVAYYASEAATFGANV